TYSCIARTEMTAFPTRRSYDLIENYDGKDIRLNESLMMTVKDFPELSAFKGHTLITTDGTTLLGADDKAGVAEIMTAAEYLMAQDRKSTRLNSSHVSISYAVFC